MASWFEFAHHEVGKEEEAKDAKKRRRRRQRRSWQSARDLFLTLSWLFHRYPNKPCSVSSEHLSHLSIV